MKANSTYKMTYQTKRILGSILDPVERSMVKKLLVDAELHASTVVKSRTGKFESSRNDSDLDI
jgi:hypothetical protein